MPEYTVSWLIDEEADDPESAARQARTRLLNPDSIADIFDVTGPDGTSVTVDLSELDGRPIG